MALDESRALGAKVGSLVCIFVYGQFINFVNLIAYEFCGQGHQFVRKCYAFKQFTNVCELYTNDNISKFQLKLLKKNTTLHRQKSHGFDGLCKTPSIGSYKNVV